MPKRVDKRDGCVMPVHYLFTGSLVSAATTILMCPSVFPRALIEADTWAHFRVKSLRFRVHPPTTAPTQFHIGAYLPGVQDTAPNSLANAAELLNSAVISNRSTAPTQWVKVSKADLAGPIPWYKSLQGAASTTEEAPGYLVVIGTGTEVYNIEVYATFEFKAAVASNNTPAELKLLAQFREKRAAREREAERKYVIELLGAKATSDP